MASDGLTLGNYQMSNGSFRLTPCRVGRRNFFGTDVYVPPGARSGDNVMFATKVMAPIDGPVRENVGLLGSPAFEIPRAASRDVELLAKTSLEERARRLVRKTRHNVATMAIFLGARWFVQFFAIYVAMLEEAEFGATSFLGVAAAAAAAVVVFFAASIVVERASTGFKGLEPEMATVYDPAFWRVERYWKMSAMIRPDPVRRRADAQRRVAVGRRAGWADGVRRRVHRVGAVVGRDWRPGESQPRRRSSNRIRSRKAFSSRIGRASAPTARSRRARWCIMAS